MANGQQLTIKRLGAVPAINAIFFLATPFCVRLVPSPSVFSCLLSTSLSSWRFVRALFLTNRIQLSGSSRQLSTIMTHRSS